MRVTLDVSGYYDWEPCPPGTEITDSDVRMLRAKQLSDGKWYMRIERAGETHHDVGLHEEQVCRRMAALESLGRGAPRHEVVGDLLRESLKHHLRASHVKSVVVHDD